MGINIDPNETRKTMIKVLLLFNIIGGIIFIFSPRATLFILVFNLIFLSIQYLMDKMQHKVEPLIESNKLSNKLNNMVNKNG